MGNRKRELQEPGSESKHALYRCSLLRIHLGFHLLHQLEGSYYIGQSENPIERRSHLCFSTLPFAWISWIGKFRGKIVVFLCCAPADTYTTPLATGRSNVEQGLWLVGAKNTVLSTFSNTVVDRSPLVESWATNRGYKYSWSRVIQSKRILCYLQIFFAFVTYKRYPS